MYRPIEYVPQKMNPGRMQEQPNPIIEAIAGTIVVIGGLALGICAVVGVIAIIGMI